jgi:hypothetical protein
MSLLRRHIFAPILTWILLLGAAFFLLAIALNTKDLSLIQVLAISFGAYVLSLSLLIFLKLHRPMKLIIREMKALLTGKSYRRIMTSKQNEIGIIAHFFNEVTRSLESISGDVKSHQRLQKELNAAQNIQRQLIPKEAPKIDGLDVVAKTRPASEIGGDTFDFFEKEDRTIFYIGDSTGHGIPAGIVMVMVDTLIETFIDLHSGLSEIMINLNKYLKPHLQTTMFMTMIVLEWLPATKQLNWVGAGHEYLVHLKTSKGEVESIKAGGIAVGMVPDNSKLVQVQSLKLEENDFLILYSDGISEAKNVAGQIYGLERLCEFVRNQASLETSSEELFKRIAIDVGRFMEGAMQLDDMTLIVAKRTGLAKSTSDKSTEWSN